MLSRLANFQVQFRADDRSTKMIRRLNRLMDNERRNVKDGKVLLVRVSLDLRVPSKLDRRVRGEAEALTRRANT